MAFLNTLETGVTTAFVGTANTFGSGLLGAFRPAFIAGFTIWITLIAYEVAFGKSEDGFTYIFTKIGKVFLIGVFALYGWPELAELLNGLAPGRGIVRIGAFFAQQIGCCGGLCPGPVFAIRSPAWGRPRSFRSI